MSLHARPSRTGVLRRLVPDSVKPILLRARALGYRVIARPRTWLRLIVNRRRHLRRLEIGPGKERVDGFETLSISPGPAVDYVADAAGRLPFGDDTFSIIYASHVLEHIPWYLTGDVLREWARVLALGGHLELWVPDGLKICHALVQAETGGESLIDLDGWYKFNPERDPCVWAAGRLFTYGRGTRRTAGANWHRALFTERYLRHLLRQAGLVAVRRMSSDDVRGHDHGWISLGLCATKPEDAPSGSLRAAAE